jgi:hypothetical protein
MSKFTETLSDILKGVTNVVKAAAPFFPAAHGPAEAIEVILEAADGTLFRLTHADVVAIAARETEAGRSISKASHLAGLREAIDRALMGVGHSVPGVALDAIMAEVVRRFP